MVIDGGDIRAGAMADFAHGGIAEAHARQTPRPPPPKSGCGWRPAGVGAGLDGFKFTFQSNDSNNCLTSQWKFCKTCGVKQFMMKTRFILNSLPPRCWRLCSLAGCDRWFGPGSFKVISRGNMFTSRAPVGGALTNLAVARGDQVKAGQLLFALERGIRGGGGARGEA
jgi:hypothetical protein